MNTADSAEEIVKIYLEGVEMSLRVTGVAAKNIAMMLIAMSKEKKMTRGKTRLTNMLKTGKPLKIFTISSDELKKFSQEAKKYGILYRMDDIIKAYKKDIKTEEQISLF